MQSLKKKLTLDSKNDLTNLVNFNLGSDKSENLHFDVLLLSIAYKVSAEKVQKNYLSWHWKEIQTLKKNWHFVWKIKWGIWWTLIRAVETLIKILTDINRCLTDPANRCLTDINWYNISYSTYPILVILNR